MKVKHVRVIVRRSVMEGVNLTVPAYEGPVLEAVHGATQIEKHEDVLIDVPDVSASNEYDRLARTYGINSEAPRIPVVEYVYGRQETGAFAKAVGASIVEGKSVRAA